MCRLLGVASSRLHQGELENIIKAFVLSNVYDPYMARLTGSRVYTHDDGWGFIATGYVNEQPTISYYKSIEPVFYESSTRILSLLVKKTVNYSPLYLVIHARKASPSEPYGIEYTHPYMRLSENGAAWFTHNGGVYKTILAEKLRVYPWIRVDSELLGFYVMDNVLSCAEGGGDVDRCVTDTYLEARDYVVKGSALNTLLLVLFKNEIYLYITHWLREISEEKKREYYAIIGYRNTNISLAGSISIREYLDLAIAQNTIILDTGIYRIEPGNIVKIHDL